MLLAGLAAALAAATGLAFAPAAGATTLTCTNIAGATTGPLGCGGLTSAVTSFGTVDIAADGNYNNAVVRTAADSQGNTREDFTVFAVGGSVTGSIGDLGSYVAMFTPNGRVPDFTGTVGGVTGHYLNAVPDPGSTFTAGPNTHCISVVSEHNGPRGAARWNVVLRNCSTNGTFTYGGGEGNRPGSVSFSFGNAWQEWAPVIGEDGLEMVNVWLFNHHNVQYTLNVTGNAGPGTHLIAYPDTSPSLNESWTIIGCTPPANTLDAGSYTLCP
jgi:hypothetical protein